MKSNVLQKFIYLGVISIAFFGTSDAKPHYEDCKTCGKIKPTTNETDLTSKEAKLRPATSLESTDVKRCHKRRNRRECDRTHVISRVPYTITESGKYCIRRDLTYTGTGSAIIVEADNVTINFANHSLFLESSAATGVLAVDVEELTILNDKISTPLLSTLNTSNAIHLIEVRKARIDNILTENTFYGLHVENSSDITETNSQHLNHYAGISANAIRIEGSTGIKLENIYVEGVFPDPNNGGSGINFTGDLNRNVLLRNLQFNNVDTAILFSNVDGVVAENIEVIAAPIAVFNALQFGTANEETVVKNIIFTNTVISNADAVPAWDGVTLIQAFNIEFVNFVIDTNTRLDESTGYQPAAIHIGCGENSGCEPFLSSENIIFRNTLIGGGNDVGFYVEQGSNIIFDEGEITGSFLANVLFDTAQMSVIKNSLIGDGPANGIVLEEGSNDNSILNNTVARNNIGLLVVLGALRNHLEHNNVYSNNATGILNQELTSEIYFNTSCNNFANCLGIQPTLVQSPGDTPVNAGSNLCCPDPT